MGLRLSLPGDVYRRLVQHLVREKDGPEEAAFVFVRASGRAGDIALEYVDWLPVPPGGFASRSSFHLELSEDMRGTVIKAAHDLGASLVEFHSHRNDWPAQFSLSDWVGLEEFVPHVLWRLKGRPYAAVVMASSGFDALAWSSKDDPPIRLEALVVGDEALSPTGLSPLNAEGYQARE